MDTIFTGLSDFHKLVLSVFKTTFTKSKPKKIIYRNYRKFNQSNFNQDLHNQLSSEQPKDYAFFENIFLTIFEEHAALKKKLLHANHAPYVTKARWKGIMKRSYFEKLYFKRRTPSSLKKYNKQKNYGSKLYKKERKAYFDKINPKEVSDNKSFWKNIKLLFSENRKIRNKIALIDENGSILFE